MGSVFFFLLPEQLTFSAMEAWSMALTSPRPQLQWRINALLQKWWWQRSVLLVVQKDIVLNKLMLRSQQCCMLVLSQNRWHVRNLPQPEVWTETVYIYFCYNGFVFKAAVADHTVCGQICSGWHSGLYLDLFRCRLSHAASRLMSSAVLRRSLKQMTKLPHCH